MCGILIMMPCIIHFLTLDKRQALAILHFVTYIQYKELSKFQELLGNHLIDVSESYALTACIVKNNTISFYIFNLYALGMVILYDANRQTVT